MDHNNVVTGINNNIKSANIACHRIYNNWNTSLVWNEYNAINRGRRPMIFARKNSIEPQTIVVYLRKFPFPL